MNTALNTIAKRLRQAKRVFIVPHVNPDGDALGASVALAHICLCRGADARLLLPSFLPDFLAWLPLPAQSVGKLAELGAWTPDLLAFIDCGDPDRAGSELAGIIRKEKKNSWNDTATINIDHHLSNKGFADFNWVEPQCSATGELVGRLAESLGMRLEGKLGEAVYLALVSDTGNFTYSNANASCLAMASRIVDAGLDIAKFMDTYENNWTIDRMHLWGRLMSEISLHENGAVAVSVVPHSLLEVSGLEKSALEGFASWLRRLRGVRVGLFVREDAENFCKISLRSMGDVDVQAIAAAFGGGGHVSAAGAEVFLPPYEAAEALLSTIRTFL